MTEVRRCDSCGQEMTQWVNTQRGTFCGECAMDLGIPGYGEPIREPIAKEFLRVEEGLRLAKRRNYASDADPLVNFRVVGEMSGLKPEQVAYVYTLKHIQAIGKAVMGGSWRESWAWETEDGVEGLKQRIADARAYLLLLAEILEEAV